MEFRRRNLVRPSHVKLSITRSLLLSCKGNFEDLLFKSLKNSFYAIKAEFLLLKMALNPLVSDF